MTNNRYTKLNSNELCPRLQLAWSPRVPLCPSVLIQMEHQSLAVKENLWFLERKDLHDRLKETEAKLTAVEFINADLRSRNNMLEHCLRQMRYSINHQRARTTAEKNEKVASAGKGFCESEEK